MGSRVTNRRTPEAFEDPGLSWSQLKAFEACVRLRSFSAAALALRVTASAVRLQVGLLEARIGAVLFERQDGRLALTEAGQTFARQAAGPFRELLAACASAAQCAAEAPLTLTAPPLFARHFLLGAAFLDWCDANRIRLDISDTKRDLFGPGMIAAIRLDPDVIPDTRATRLLGIALGIAAAPSIAATARPHDARWWMDQTLLCPSAGDAAWNWAWKALPIETVSPPRRVPYSSYSAAMASACAGHGVILAPMPFALTEFASGRLAPIADIRLEAAGTYSLIMRDTIALTARGRALARRLIRLCVESTPHASGVPGRRVNR